VQPEDYEVQESMEEDEDGWITFDKSVTTTGTLAEIFRIFTEGEVLNTPPDLRPDDTFALQEIVATDGSCFNNGHDDAVAGAGIYFVEDDPRNQAIRLPPTLEQSNQTAEMTAVKEVVRTLDEDTDVKIESDSKYVINALTKNKKKWEDQGYIGIANKALNQATVATLRQRKHKTKIKWVKGHSGHARNEGADIKADEGAKKPVHDEVPLDIPPALRVTGAKLSVTTQSLAYKAIRERKMKTKLKKRDRTVVNIEKIKAEIEDGFASRPTESKIWKSMRSKDFSRQIRNFLWKTTHDAYIVGTHWLRESNSPEKKERSQCQHCGKIDTMEHILSQCEIPGQSQIWALAKEMWTKRNPNWPWPGLGIILGAGLATFKDEDNKIKPGDARLYRIIVTESAYLIWKMRCERVMKNNGAHPTEVEIHNRWVNTMNARVQMDCNMTHRRYKKALPAKTVLRTWTGVLANEDQLPEDWTGVSGVLVGIGPKRQQGGRRGR
jgi:ribonuclease HI